MSNEVKEIAGIYFKDEKARQEIEKIKGNKNNTIVIGDSYLMGQNANEDGQYCDNNWGVFLKELLGLADNEFFKFGEGASGFYQEGNQGHTFLELLQANIGTITEKEKIKNIIVCGGCNDVNASSNTVIESCIESFVNYCKSNFPNAQVYVGMIGGYNNPDVTATSRGTLKARVYQAYLNCRKYGAVYLNGTETIMQDYTDNYSSDKVHPSLKGQKEIAQGIYQCLKTGNLNYYRSLEPVALTTTDKVNKNTVWVHLRPINEKILVNFNGYMDLANPVTAGTLALSFSDVVFRYLRKSQEHFQETPITARLMNIAGTKEVAIKGRFALNNNSTPSLIFEIPSISDTDLQRIILNNELITLEAINY